MSYTKTPWGREIPYTSPITGKSTTLYNISVLAEALGRTRQTIRKWEIDGIIPPTPFKQNGKRLYAKEHIDVMVECAEKAKIGTAKAYTYLRFSEFVYPKFQAVNDMFFKKEKKNEAEE